MEQILKDILKELQYQTKLMDGNVRRCLSMLGL